MKRLLVIISFALLAIATNAQISTSVYYDGYWGNWSDQHSVKIFGGYSGFIVYHINNHPSLYCFDFQINDYVSPSKEQIKEHYKKNEWYVYSGTVKYFVVESEPTIKDILKKRGFPRYHKDTRDENGNYAVKRVAKATIKIAPYKDHPRTYNIYFDNVGVGISLNNVSFKIR